MSKPRSKPVAAPAVPVAAREVAPVMQETAIVTQPVKAVLIDSPFPGITRMQF